MILYLHKYPSPHRMATCCTKAFINTTAPSVAPSTSSIVSFTAPFTCASLARIRNALADAAPERLAPPPTRQNHTQPLCNVENTSGVLLEVRGKLRMHVGEVRWVPSDAVQAILLSLTTRPSASESQAEEGNVGDPTGGNQRSALIPNGRQTSSFLATALRETQETRKWAFIPPKSSSLNRFKFVLQN